MVDSTQGQGKSLDSVPFSVRCDGGSEGSLSVSTKRLSVAVAQRISRRGVEQMWDFVLVLSDCRDGQLTTRVLLCHPDWDEPLEIAAVESDSEKMKVQITGSQTPME